nr:hypothetical protein 75 [bacterium]
MDKLELSKLDLNTERFSSHHTLITVDGKPLGGVKEFSDEISASYDGKSYSATIKIVRLLFDGFSLLNYIRHKGKISLSIQVGDGLKPGSVTEYSNLVLAHGKRYLDADEPIEDHEVVTLVSEPYDDGVEMLKRHLDIARKARNRLDVPAC